MKTILITGATDGLGRAVAIALAKQGHTLLLHGRNAARGEALIEELAKHTSRKKLRYYNADFLEINQIKKLAQDILTKEERLDVLINNAGLGIESSRRESRDGNEALWQVNYLGTYILTRMLKPLLAKTAPSRIVNVASAGQAPVLFDDINQELSWSGYQGYCQSKLAQIMLGIELSEDYGREGVTINSLHPASMMPTKIVQNTIDTIEDGIHSVVRLVTDESIATSTGQYFFKCREEAAEAQAYNAEARARLLNLSQIMTGG